MTYHRVCNNTNTTRATCEAGTAYPFGALEFTPFFFVGFVFHWRLVYYGYPVYALLFSYISNTFKSFDFTLF